MKFKIMSPNLRGNITKGFRDAFKRSNLYKSYLYNVRVEKPRYNKDGSISKKPDVFYRCECCNKLHKQNNVQVDHIDPVIAINETLEMLSFNDYARRVFLTPCQVLCKSCHKEKSKKENSLRRKYKKSKNN